MKSIKDVMKNIIDEDFVKDTAHKVCARFVEAGHVPNCTDTDDQDEIIFTDEIEDAITEALERLGYTILNRFEIDLMKQEQLNPKKR